MDLESLYQCYLRCKSVSTDTRILKPGAMFFALKGPRFDGNMMALKALEKGALYSVIDDPASMLDKRFILVEDVLATMQALARKHRSHLRYPVLGITGSNGKTTTKELLAAALQTAMKVVATEGNFNNHIGLPLTILNAPLEADLLIVEMGTNQPGDIAELCHIAEPDLGIITNIGEAHLEKLLTRQGILNEKRALFDSVRSNGGTFFLNSDDEYLRQLNEEYENIVIYNLKGSAEFQLQVLSKNDDIDLSFVLYARGRKEAIKTHLVGAYNIYNVIVALTVSRYFGLDIFAAGFAIGAYRPANMRSQKIYKGSNVVIMDGYNANPSSVAVSLEDFLFLKVSDKRKIVILGDMLELGEEGPRLHLGIVRRLRQHPEVTAWLVGPLYSSVSEGLMSFDDVESLIRHLKSSRPNNALIFIKGSRGIALEKTLDVL